MEETERKVLHLKYWIGILIFIMILVVSTTWFDVTDLADKLSFALTLISAVLALLAIYITFNFNNLFANNVTRFLNINEEIQDTSDELQIALKNLDEKLETVPKSIKGLHKKLDTTKLLLEESEYDQPSHDNISFENYIEWNKNKGFYFTINLNFKLIAFLYLTIEAFKKNTEIEIEDFKSVFGSEELQYYYSFLYTLNAINICSFFVNDKIIKITHCIPPFHRNIQSWIDEIISFLEKKDRENQVESIKSNISTVSELL